MLRTRRKRGIGHDDIAELRASFEKCLQIRENHGDVDQLVAYFKDLATKLPAKENLKDAVRQNGLLEHALIALSHQDEPENLVIQYLRFIGNAIADNDSNRDLALQHLTPIARCLTSPSTASYTVRVLFNLLTDYESAAIIAAAARLDADLATYYKENDPLPESLSDLIVDMVIWISEKLKKEQKQDDDGIITFDFLLSSALDYNEDNYEDLLRVILSFLEEPEFQEKAAHPEIFRKLIQLMEDLESRLSAKEQSEAFRYLSTVHKVETVPLQDSRASLLAQLITFVSASSATDAFPARFTNTDSIIEKVKSSAKRTTQKPSLVCYITVVANVATTDDVCIDWVEEHNLHLALITILETVQKPAILYPAAGVLRNLAFPITNRSDLVAGGALNTCRRLLETDNAPVRGIAAHMLHKLIEFDLDGSITTRVVQDPVPELVSNGETSSQGPHTLLSLIVRQVLGPAQPLPSTSMRNPQIEIGRAIIALLKNVLLHKRDDFKELWLAMLGVPRIAGAIVLLLRQRFYPDARSEGLLGLALITQKENGALAVLEEIRNDDKFLAALRELAVDAVKADAAAKNQNRDAPGGRLQSDHDAQHAVMLLLSLGMALEKCNPDDERLLKEMEALSEDILNIST